jgi:MFS family permease
MEETPGHQAGVAAAVMTAGLDAGKMVGPLIGGIVATMLGVDSMFRVVPFGFLAIYLLLYLATRHHRGAAVEPSAAGERSLPEEA